MPICGGIWRRSFSPSKSFLNLCKDPISAGSCWILFDVKTSTSRLVQNPMSDGTYSILFSSNSRTRSDFMLPIVSGRNSSRLFEILSSKYFIMIQKASFIEYLAADRDFQYQRRRFPANYWRYQAPLQFSKSQFQEEWF